MSDDLSGIIRAGISSVEGCPVLTRLNAFLVDQGVQATLEHVVRNPIGNPVDLTSLFGPDSHSDSEGGAAIKLRIKEALGKGSYVQGNPIWEVDAVCETPSGGVVRGLLPENVIKRAGIYYLSWGVQNTAGKTVLINNSLLSVDRSLFSDIDIIQEDQGPLTIQALRLYLRDSHPNENLRLDDVEFGSEEICAAILRPIEFYNEHPPPLGVFTTRNFPSRYHWSQAAISKLFEMAAIWYRRNKQQIQAGGLMDDDLNRDKDYEAKSQQLWEEFKTWVAQDKVVRNARMMVGHVGSIYGRRW